MRGNTAIFKCQIPSFVSDHVDLTEWISTENDTYKTGDEYGSEMFAFSLLSLTEFFIDFIGIFPIFNFSSFSN
jgi:hypothetical protein